MQHVACVWPPCCDLLRHAECCWLRFENGQILHVTFVDVAWSSCSRLARFVQQCCAWACALVRVSTRNMSQHVTTGRPNARNMLRPTMLWYVVFKCCDRLADLANARQQCWDLLRRDVAIVWPGLNKEKKSLGLYLCRHGTTVCLKFNAKIFFLRRKSQCFQYYLFNV